MASGAPDGDLTVTPALRQRRTPFGHTPMDSSPPLLTISFPI